MPDINAIVQVIQLMLAPGLMISACGLLILGMNNKYSLVVNRIRLLNEERRKVLNKVIDGNFTYEENVRIESISLQLDKLTLRVKFVRNAVLSYTIAVALFVLTSLLIGVEYFAELNLNVLVIIIFLVGMSSVLAGVLYAANETWEGYKIIHLEVKIDE